MNRTVRRNFNDEELLNTSKVCFLRVMKNFCIFPYLYRINIDKNVRGNWCKYPTVNNNPLNKVMVESPHDQMRRPNLNVQTTIPQETYDKIMDIVNSFIRQLIEPRLIHLNIDLPKFGEELFNQVGYRLFGEVFVQDMKILDEAMGDKHMPQSQEEFNRFIEQMKIEYESYLNNHENDDNIMNFGTFVRYKMERRI